MAHLIPTEEFTTDGELRDLFDLEEDDELDRVIPVCAGEWRREGNRYRLWADSNWEN
jgi:hypothetical protein